MTIKEELIPMIGKEASANTSPTFRAVLVRINKNTCTWRVVENKDHPSLNVNAGRNGRLPIGGCYLVPLYISGNMFFGR